MPYDKTFPPTAKPAGAWGAYAAQARDNQTALNTWHAGTSQPATPETWQRWLDTSVSPPVLRVWNGSSWVLVETAIAIFKEIADARGSAVSLAARIAVSIAADGTLIPGTSLNPDEFKTIAGTYTRTGASTFTVGTTDLTAVFAARRRVKMVGATTEYSEIASAVFGGGTTTVTITGTNVPTSMTANASGVALINPTAAVTSQTARNITSPSGGYVEDYLAELVTARNGLASLNARVASSGRTADNALLNGDVEVFSAGAAAAPDSWVLAGAAAAAAREATIIKHGTYSAKLTRAGADCQLKQDAVARLGGVTYVKGRTFTLGMWVYATVASRARIRVDDGDTITYSSYHAGDSAWAFLTVTKTTHASATTKLEVALQVDTGDTSAYGDGAILVEGAEAFAFSPHPQDVVPGTVAVLDRLVAAATISNNATEQTQYAYSVPAGTLSTNKMLRLLIVLDVLNNTGADRTITIRLKFGATTFGTSGTFTLPSNANPYVAVLTVWLFAANATNAQVGRVHFNLVDPVAVEGNPNGPPRYDYLSRHNTVAEDSTLAKTVALTTEMSVASANLTNTIRLALLERVG